MAETFKKNPTQFEAVRKAVNRDMEKQVMRVDYRGQSLDFSEIRMGSEKAFRERIKRIIKKIEG